MLVPYIGIEDAPPEVAAAILGVYVLIARITKGLKIDMDGEIPGLEDTLKKLVTGK